MQVKELTATIGEVDWAQAEANQLRTDLEWYQTEARKTRLQINDLKIELRTMEKIIHMMVRGSERSTSQSGARRSISPSGSVANFLVSSSG